MRKLLVLAAALAFTGTASAQTYQPAPTSGNTVANPSQLTMSTYNQGVYAGALQSSASQDVSIAIAPYSHVQLLSAASVSRTIAPGGSGNNQTLIDNDLRYATNRAVAENNTISVNVTSPQGQAAFDELNFLVRTRLWGGGPTVVVEDIAQGGSAGAFHGPWGPMVWRYDNFGKGPQVFANGFGQVVAVAPIRYDITVSDVALQGTRDFTVEFTIAP